MGVTRTRDSATTTMFCDEKVTVFPATGYLDCTDTQRQWVVDFHAWVYSHRYTRQLGTLWRKLTGLQTENLAALQPGSLLTQRLQWFGVDNLPGRRFTLDIEGHTFTLDPSQANGHFHTLVRLPAEIAYPDETASGPEIPLHYTLRRLPDDRIVATGTVCLIPPRGISIVSDIDDTIKHSDVVSKLRLLRNTFSRPFREVAGMAHTYTRWQQQHNASYHYLTASPWQLYQPLSDFIRDHGFPQGSFHMKHFRYKDASILNLFKSPVEYKTLVIQSLLQRYPHRQFVLVGDSGENDALIYSNIARACPHKVLAIFIRTTSPTDRISIEALDCPVPIQFFRSETQCCNLDWK